ARGRSAAHGGLVGGTDRSVRARRRRGEPGLLRLPQGPQVTLNLLPMPRSVEEREGVAPPRDPEVRRDPSLPAHGYVLDVGADTTTLVAADDPGEQYGRATLEQLARLRSDGVPTCHIED